MRKAIHSAKEPAVEPPIIVESDYSPDSYSSFGVSFNKRKIPTPSISKSPKSLNDSRERMRYTCSFKKTDMTIQKDNPENDPFDNRYLSEKKYTTKSSIQGPIRELVVVMESPVKSGGIGTEAKGSVRYRVCAVGLKEALDDTFRMVISDTDDDLDDTESYTRSSKAFTSKSKIRVTFQKGAPSN
ncbi:e631ebf2-1340-4503-ba00-1013508f0a67 [Sclerotinia trifoliorum]|uniref:E631ebf2-1340-4503-ba00-1013508f0a67 n=1 Tax=Sclerotinia trifoliorum TaxID=28548 RepID=A0A8H2VWK2_9HELO|nr:e631ebf2-1340-4503-ba00-1013508f0a67 [Sclerotinia trifoliorum]